MRITSNTVLVPNVCSCRPLSFLLSFFTDFVPSATIGWALEFGPEMVGTKLANSPELTNVLTTAATQITGRGRPTSNPQAGATSR